MNTDTAAPDPLSRVVAISTGKGGVGKCLSHFSDIRDPETGRVMTVREAVESRLPTVHAVDEDGKLGVFRIGDWIDSGIKPVLRLTTASGRSLTVTPHHRMLMPDGWRRADELNVGETLAGAGRLTQPHKTNNIATEELDLLALMLAEAGTSGPATRFTTTDAEMVSLATVGAARLDATVKSYLPMQYDISRGTPLPANWRACECGCGDSTRNSGPKRRFIRHRGRWTPHAVTEFPLRHDPDFVLAKNKTMPLPVYRLADPYLARFIAVFWMCNGYVSPAGSAELVLASEPLVRAFQHLLLRFGIQSRVGYEQVKFNGKECHAWRLNVYAHCLPAFDTHIPLWGDKQARLERRVDRILASGGGNPHVGSPSLTPELWDLIRSFGPKPGYFRDPGKPQLRTVADRLGWTFSGKVPMRELLTNKTANGQRYISRRALRAYIDCFGAEAELGHLVSPDIFWDHITAIEPAGEEQVYDLTVPGPANFLANDLVAHNTSLTSNVSGQLARAGYRILAADLDLGGNLSLDLGYADHELNDDGTALVDAIWRAGDLPVIRSVREGLDVIPGGRHLEMLTALAYSPMGSELPAGGVAEEFARRLAEIAGDYDLVLLDCAPGNPVLQDLALGAARYMLIPTKSDAGGWDGLRLIGPRVKKARKINPQLTYLGMVLFGHGTSAGRIRASTKEHLEEVGETVPLFEAFIRHSESAAHDCRNRGQLAHELARDAAIAGRERLAILRQSKGRHRVTELAQMPTALSGSADSLAGDYEQVAREMLQRISALEQTTSIAAVGR